MHASQKQDYAKNMPKPTYEIHRYIWKKNDILRDFGACLPRRKKIKSKSKKKYFFVWGDTPHFPLECRFLSRCNGVCNVF